VDLARGEMVEAEPTRLIEKRPSREMDSDEREEPWREKEFWQESLRACNVRGRRGREEERLLAWCEYHREQAERHYWVVERHQEDSCYHEPPLLRGGG
jgi:hypothetical protein